mgnify:CR=1 FL=1
MARVKLEDVDKVVTSSTQFFQMKNDGDIEKVNILYETIDDVECHSLHKVKVNGRDRWVECLREYLFHCMLMVRFNFGNVVRVLLMI